MLLLARRGRRATGSEAPMAPLGNDRWRGAFTCRALGRYRYTVTAWVDHFLSWRHDFERRVDADDIAHRRARRRRADRRGGRSARAARDARALARLGERAAPRRRRRRRRRADGARARRGRCAAHRAALSRPRASRRRTPTELPLVVDRERARFRTWYELFPRSAAPRAGRARHASRRARRACRTSPRMGFDVAVPAADPPDRPRCSRKGRNNALDAAPDDVGSPWAIGAAEGGHKAIHPRARHARRLPAPGRAGAREHGIEIALDIAFQCAPDHPYVTRASGVVPQAPRRHASSTPRTRRRSTRTSTRSTSRRDDWRALWDELQERLRLLDRRRACTIFRVDNPHTKPFAFWEWVIARGQARASRRDLPGRGVHAAEGDAPAGQARLHAVVHLLHLAQHQARADRVLHRARARARARVLPAQRVAEHARHPAPSTCSTAAAPAFMARLRAGRDAGGELRHLRPGLRAAGARAARAGQRGVPRLREVPAAPLGPRRAPTACADFIARVNRIRRDNPALQRDWQPALPARSTTSSCIAYAQAHAGRRQRDRRAWSTSTRTTRRAAGSSSTSRRSASSPTQPFQMHDLLTDARFLWQGARNFVSLDPQQRAGARLPPAAPRVRDERDFDYFL